MNKENDKIKIKADFEDIIKLAVKNKNLISIGVSSPPLGA